MRSSSLSWFASAVLAMGGCGVEVSGDEAVESSTAELRGGCREDSSIVSEEHFVDVGDDVVLRVVEKRQACPRHRGPRRAILLLTATLVGTQQYDTAVPGDDSFNAMNRLAAAGFRAFSADYEGYGGSTHPADGKTVTAERLLPQMGSLVEFIRRRTHVNRVDLLGSSLGSSLAVALARPDAPVRRNSIGKIVLLSHVYKEVTPLFAAIFFNPAVRALLENAPGGYVPTDASAYGLILAAADPAAAAWGATAFPGVYAVGPTLEGFDLPVFAAETATRPALQVWGDADLITPESDVIRFQDEYGGDAELLILPGGGHAPTLEPVRDAMWDGVLEFLDDDCNRR